MVTWDVTIKDQTLVRVKDEGVAKRITDLLNGPGGLYEVPEDVEAAYKDGRGERKQVEEKVAAKRTRRRAKTEP